MDWYGDWLDLYGSCGGDAGLAVAVGTMLRLRLRFATAIAIAATSSLLQGQGLAILSSSSSFLRFSFLFDTFTLLDTTRETRALRTDTFIRFYNPLTRTLI